MIPPANAIHDGYLLFVEYKRCTQCYKSKQTKKDLIHSTETFILHAPGLKIHARHSVQFLHDKSSKCDGISEIFGFWKLLLFHDCRKLTQYLLAKTFN